MHQDLIQSLQTMVYPGLSGAAAEIPGRAVDLAKKTAVFVYKKDQPLLWVSLLGGTGTGKSTLFNALCGRPVSRTGLERPKTRGPVAFAHHTAVIDGSFPLTGIRIERHRRESDPIRPLAGTEGCLTVVEHDRRAWTHFVLVDSPDLDSIAPAHREMSRDFYLLSDAVIFVTSPEKYADEVPAQLLKQVIDEEKPYFLLINKVQNESVKAEWIKILHRKGIAVCPDRIWSIGCAAAQAPEAFAELPGLREFTSALSEFLSGSQNASFRKGPPAFRIRLLRESIDHLLHLLENEDAACRQWLRRLDRLHRQVSQALIQSEADRFTQKNREYLRAEVRRLFARYDVLARPRRMVQEIVLLPLRFLGYRKESGGKHSREALCMLKEKIDLAAVESAVELFNRSVFEALSPPAETAPLNRKLRRQGTVLEYEKIRDLTLREHERLAAWLEARFQTLYKGLPKGKRWGIYSTSVLWGILLLSLETAIGGGFTMLDALLDSALAPFITKGTVELFAYREIRKIVRELSDRYRQVLLAALNVQHEQYRQCLLSVSVRKEAIARLSAYRTVLAAEMNTPALRNGVSLGNYPGTPGAGQ